MLRFLLKSTAKILLVLVPDDGPGTHTSVFAFSEDSLKNHKGHIQKKNTSPKALANCISGVETLRNVWKIKNKFVCEHRSSTPVKQ